MSIDLFVQRNSLNLWLLAQTCTVVVTRTHSVGPTPGIWSESEKATQQLSVVVEETLCGQAPENPQLQLDLPLVEGTRIAGATPGLAAWIGDPHSRVVLFLDQGDLADEDIGAFRADPELVEYLRKLCNGPVPPGIGPIFYQLSQLAESDPEVKAAIADLSPSVLDIVADEQTCTRVTIVSARMRVFTGIRLERVMKSREPDVTLQATPAEIASALTGRRDVRDLVLKGEAPDLLAALERAAGVIARTPEHTVLIDRTSEAIEDK